MVHVMLLHVTPLFAQCPSPESSLSTFAGRRMSVVCSFRWSTYAGDLPPVEDSRSRRLRWLVTPERGAEVRGDTCRPGPQRTEVQRSASHRRRSKLGRCGTLETPLEETLQYETARAVMRRREMRLVDGSGSERSPGCPAFGRRMSVQSPGHRRLNAEQDGPSRSLTTRAVSRTAAAGSSCVP